MASVLILVYPMKMVSVEWPVCLSYENGHDQCVYPMSSVEWPVCLSYENGHGQCVYPMKMVMGSVFIL